jgi:cytochrome c biogenesis protein CcmG/thiol:disulfide interchange protein DsbE
MKKSINIIIAAGFLFIFTMSFYLLFPWSGPSVDAFEPWPLDPLIGRSAPDFSLEDLNGKSVSLSSFRGKPVIVNFWATWCPYCRKERDHLKKLYEDYSDKNLVIVSVSIDRSFGTLKKFMEKNPAPFIILYDGDSKVASQFHVAGLPSSFLINRDGVIERKFTGYREWSSDSSRKIIDALTEDRQE